ncbi:MAG: hypothetical protein K2Q23_15875 [Bryobacteraceae bacterium]|nr:hypothetical protein [Bryobacteraceae bacterium]
MPAAVRQQLGLNQQSELVWALEGSVLQLTTKAEARRRACELTAQLLRPGAQPARTLKHERDLQRRREAAL